MKAKKGVSFGELLHPLSCCTTLHHAAPLTMLHLSSCRTPDPAAPSHHAAPPHHATPPYQASSRCCTTRRAPRRLPPRSTCVHPPRPSTPHATPAAAVPPGWLQPMVRTRRPGSDHGRAVLMPWSCHGRAAVEPQSCQVRAPCPPAGDGVGARHLVLQEHPHGQGQQRRGHAGARRHALRPRAHALKALITCTCTGGCNHMHMQIHQRL